MFNVLGNRTGYQAYGNAFTGEQINPVESGISGVAGKKAVKKRELLSLIGILFHVCKVVRSGRAFLHRLITLSTSAKRLDHFIQPDKCARSDIEWWYTYSKGWNGVSMMSMVNRTSPEFSLTTDASGSWGCGGFSTHNCFH